MQDISETFMKLPKNVRVDIGSFNFLTRDKSLLKNT